MMRIVLLVVLLSVYSFQPGFGQGQATTVFIKSEDREGQGFTRPLGSQCFVVVPRHVVERRQEEERGGRRVLDPNPIRVIGQNAERTWARVVNRTFGDDIAILEVMPDGGRVCRDWPDAGKSRSVLRSSRNTSTAEVMYVDGQGRRQWYSTTLVGDDGDRQVEFKGEEVARKGFSGGVVRMNGVVVGMVNHVDAQKGVVRAYRFDHVDRVLGGFFDQPIPPPRSAVVSSVLLPGLGQFASNRRPSGAALLGISLVGTAVAFGLPRDVVKTDTYLDFTGTPREYSRVERGYPYRKVSPLVWIVGGTLSAIESVSFARQLRRPESRWRTAASGGMDKFVRLSAGDAPGGTVELALLQLRF